MNKFSLRIFAAVGLCAAMTVGAASAKGDDKNTNVWQQARERQAQQQQARAQQTQQARVLHRRDHHPVVVTNTPAGRPTGWDHGRKTGWGNCDVPPGQAKKVGCTPVHHRDHRWVQRRDHRWEERREHERREARRQAEHRAAERRHERIEMARKAHHDRH